jgi:hypothetical protein
LGEEFVNLAEQLQKDFGVLTRENAFYANLYSAPTPKETLQTKQFGILHNNKLDSDGLLDGLHPLAFAAKANAEDTPSFREAMNSEDAEGFYEAMKLEIDSLKSMEAWEEVERTAAHGRNILGCVWVFRRKRYPDGSVRKLKARLCVRGDQQIEGVDFFETFAPVVAWSTVRLLLILTIVLGLATKQVDYTLAFVHSELEDVVYMEMPPMFSVPGYILRLKCSLYGLRQSPLNWFKMLKAGLQMRGFVQSNNDACLFISKDCICLVYVDDCLFFAQNDATIMDVINSLKNPQPTKENPTPQRFMLNVEDSVAGFLGIHMAAKTTGTIELTQKGLIDRVITVTGLSESLDKQTPADTKPLGKDDNGPPCEEKWSYPSLVGMLMYLASNTRPDIAYAVHQCAPFMHCPKRSHEKAVKRIVRYLKATKENGMIMKPSKDLSLDMYADADFAGLWNTEDANDPICVRSWTGYIITLGDTPVLWASKLQTEISLSTAEAEYIALSTAMRSLLPLRRLIKELADSVGVKRDEVTKVSCVWEDNNAARTIANSPYINMTPRTKSIAVKYHWFRQHLQPGEIEILRIDTDKQKADIFTKGLARKEFESKRRMIVGW